MADKILFCEDKYVKCKDKFGTSTVWQVQNPDYGNPVRAEWTDGEESFLIYTDKNRILKKTKMGTSTVK